MAATLDELGLTELVTSIEGLSPVGAAAILAETGDLHRFTSARAVAKHAGLAPRERMSGTFAGKARLSGAGRPALRTAAWRAVWGCLQNNRVYAARYRHLTTREHNKLKPTQAQTVIAAAILRQLHAVVTTGRAWDPDVAVHGTRRRRQAAIAACQPHHHGLRQAGGRGEPSAALRHPVISTLIMGSPARRLLNPITRRWA
jgi:hypothetical protein